MYDNPYILTGIRLLKVVFIINPDFDLEANSIPGQGISMSVKLINSLSFNSDRNLAHFVQSLSTHRVPTGPFTLEVEYEAIFALDSSTSLEQEDTLRMQFAKMVFPYCSEFIAEITRRGGFPPMILNLSSCMGGQNLQYKPMATH
ncbi:MAG: protein-export chaperone SecB [Deltaproteobacteria bacterium]|jgi:preprotein translocase subunit SecB|nr:protein-export chaperone SecB [Deltaproteobacteria bacterium]